MLQRDIDTGGVSVRDLHGNGDNGNTAVTAGIYRGNGSNCCGNTAVMVIEIAVIPRERLHLKRYYRGSGNRIL